VRGAGIISQDVPEHVQRGERDPISRREGWNGASVNQKCGASIPEMVNVRDLDAVVCAAPESVMQLDRDGQVRVEIVAAPLPGEGLHQGTKVIVG